MQESLCWFLLWDGVSIIRLRPRGDMDELSESQDSSGGGS